MYLVCRLLLESSVYPPDLHSFPTRRSSDLRLTGESWPDAVGLGALVQTKGLMELIVLTILLDRGIIATNVFSALVLMAVLTTMLAMPLTRLALRWGARDQPAPGSEPAVTIEIVHPVAHPGAG